MCHFEVSDDTYDAAQSSRWPALIPPGGFLEQRHGVGHVGGRKKRTLDHESEGAEQGLVVIVAVGKRVIDEPHSIVDQFYPVAAAFLAPAVAPDPAPVIRVPEDEPAAARSLGPRKYAHLRTVGTLYPYLHIPPVWQVRPEVLELTQYTPVAPHAVSEVPSAAHATTSAAVRKRAPPLLKHVGLTGTLLPHELQFLKLTRSVLAVAWVSSGLTSRRTYGLVVDTVAVGMVSNRA